MATDLPLAEAHVVDDPGHVQHHNDLAHYVNVVESEQYNVRHFGATGDGSTDDTAAIQAAITAVSTSNGGIVYFPPGTYKISSAITLKDKVTIRGSGAKTSVIRQLSNTANGLFYNSTLDGPPGLGVTIEDIMLYGPVTIAAWNTTAPVAGTGNGIHLTANSLDGISIRNVSVQGFHGSGIYCQGPIVCHFDHIESAQNGIHGFHMDGATEGVITSLLFTNCYARWNQVDGYYLDNGVGSGSGFAVYCAFIGCASDDNAVNYHVKYSRGVSFVGCGSEYHSSPDVRYRGTSTKGWHLEGVTAVTLTGCVCYNALGNDVHVATAGTAHSNGVLIQNMRCTGGSTSSIQVDTLNEVMLSQISTSSAGGPSSNGFDISATAKVVFWDNSGNALGIGKKPVSTVDVLSSINDATLRIKNTVAGATNTNSLIETQAVDAANVAYGALITGEGSRRWRVLSNGDVKWSDGTSAPDATLSRISGDGVLLTPQIGLNLKSGANKRFFEATLTAGTVTVANTSVTASSLIMLSRHSENASTALGQLVTGSRTAGVGFTIKSLQPAAPGSLQTGDASTVTYIIVEPV